MEAPKLTQRVLTRTAEVLSDKLVAITNPCQIFKSSQLSEALENIKKKSAEQTIIGILSFIFMHVGLSCVDIRQQAGIAEDAPGVIQSPSFNSLGTFLITGGLGGTWVIMIRPHANVLPRYRIRDSEVASATIRCSSCGVDGQIQAH